MRIAVWSHCQMNENPCSNHEIRVLFEHGFVLKMSPELFAQRYTKCSFDHFAIALIRENVAHQNEFETTLLLSKFHRWRHFV